MPQTAANQTDINIPIISDACMGWQSFNRQLFNPTIIKHNHFDGHIATAKLCGTHWVKYMLSHVLSQIHDLPEPEHVRDDKIVGHPKNQPVYENIPRIAVTHSHPHYTMYSHLLYEKLNVPPCVFFVRNPKDILVSIYEKSKGEYMNKKYGYDGADHIPFATYLRTPANKKYRLENIWGIIRFFNAWGNVQAKNPEKIIMIKYEDMLSDTKTQLQKIITHFNITGASDEILEKAIERSSRDKMRQKLDKNEDQYERSVNLEKRNFEDWYTEDDNAYYNNICRRYLKYDFGYLSNNNT